MSNSPWAACSDETLREVYLHYYDTFHHEVLHYCLQYVQHPQCYEHHKHETIAFIISFDVIVNISVKIVTIISTDIDPVMANNNTILNTDTIVFRVNRSNMTIIHLIIIILLIVKKINNRDIVNKIATTNIVILRRNEDILFEFRSSFNKKVLFWRLNWPTLNRSCSRSEFTKCSA